MYLFLYLNASVFYLFFAISSVIITDLTLWKLKILILSHQTPSYHLSFLNALACAVNCSAFLAHPSPPGCVSMCLLATDQLDNS